MKVSTRPHTRQAQQAKQQWEKGVALSRRGQWEEALPCFEVAVEMQPDDEVYLLNAARTCFALQRPDEALAYAARAAERRPDMELPVLLKIKALIQLQRHGEAMACLEALPDSLRQSRDYWVNLGLCSQHVGKQQDAINAFMNALAERMDDAMTHYRMGVSFYDLELKEEASECFRTALLLGLGANALHVHGMLAYAERESCRWAQAAEEEARLAEMIARLPFGSAVMTAPFAHVTLSGDPVHQLKASSFMANTWRGVRPAMRVDRVKESSRLRIGYLSSDFYQHATCVLMCEVFEHHDRDRFEVFAYSHGVDDGSAMRRRVMHAVEHFVDLRGMPDEQIAQRIADDDLDLLIDLKGYTAHNRMGVLARRPAPVQATFLGFPGTTGGRFMDYIIGDPVVTPLAHADHFVEKIAQMPVCYQPNDRKRPRPQAMCRADVGLPEDALVLCGFNQAYKISPEVLDVWCRLLRDIPGSVLWLLDWHGQARPHLEAELLHRGVDLQRIHWAPRWGLAEHISRIRLADIFIDTWPCNAHTTASDALWAGLPVVSYAGTTFASRVAASLVRACDLPELACHSIDTYCETVRTLAADPARRQALRARLDDARETSPLFDSELFTRDFEALLARMVVRHRSGLPPVALEAEPGSKVVVTRD